MSQKFKHVCAVQSAYSITQGLQFNNFSLQYTKCPLQLHVVNVFQLWTLMEHVYFLHKQRTKYVSIFQD
jgi:hypothetical protein